MGFEKTPLWDSQGNRIKVNDVILSPFEKLYFVIKDRHLGYSITHIVERTIEKLTPDLANEMLVVRI